MNKEEKEAIEKLIKFVKITKSKEYKENGWHGYYDDEMIFLGENIETVLNLIQKQQEEI